MLPPTTKANPASGQARSGHHSAGKTSNPATSNGVAIMPR